MAQEAGGLLRRRPGERQARDVEAALSDRVCGAGAGPRGEREDGAGGDEGAQDWAPTDGMFQSSNRIRHERLTANEKRPGDGARP